MGNWTVKENVTSIVY